MAECIRCKSKLKDEETVYCCSEGTFFDSDDPYEQFQPDGGTEPTGYEEYICKKCMRKIKEENK